MSLARGACGLRRRRGRLVVRGSTVRNRRRKYGPKPARGGPEVARARGHVTKSPAGHAARRHYKFNQRRRPRGRRVPGRRRLIVLRLSVDVGGRPN